MRNILVIMTLVVCLNMCVDGEGNHHAAGFVLGARWFMENTKTGTEGKYLTTEYRNEVVSVR
jgi:hypothetical protein